jgi:hypothetical protein
MNGRIFNVFFSQVNTMTIFAQYVLTTALKCIKTQKPHTLAGFEPGIFYSVGGRHDHDATPPGQWYNGLLVVSSYHGKKHI